MKVPRSARETRKQIESVTLSEGIVTICGDQWHAGAFCNCESLKEVNLPNTLVEIGMCAFSGCGSLSEIIIPANVKSIGPQSFQNCIGLSRIAIPGKVKKIGKNTFANCPKLVIYGSAGSYAESYATENSIPFVAE